jgi:hypothetical protein
MKVQIIEKETNVLITEIPIVFGMIGENTKEEDVINEAWLTAIEDKTVEAEKKKNYIFLIQK